MMMRLLSIALLWAVIGCSSTPSGTGSDAGDQIAGDSASGGDTSPGDRGGGDGVGTGDTPAGDPFVAGDSNTCSTTACDSVCCRADEFCALGTTCALDQGSCTDSDDCLSDAYCSDDTCLPYETPALHTNDLACSRPSIAASYTPVARCSWSVPAGDAFPDHLHVMATPLVVDFDFDQNAATLAPSIVFPTFPTAGSYSAPGVLRIAAGSDCSQQFSFDNSADAVMAAASPAVGDLDGDGRAEIVAARHDGGLIAFRFDTAAGSFSRWWTSGTCAGGGPPTVPDTTGGIRKWSGPSVHDLDDDGLPEIIYGATVYRADGCLISDTRGFSSYLLGVVPVVADVDEDGEMELIEGNAIHQWNAIAEDWQAESYFAPGALSEGQVAVAEFGSYPLAAFEGEDRPEVVVVSSGTVRVQTLDGTVVFGPVSMPGGGTGGPPAVADFDGDGRPEIAVAGATFLSLFDFDCAAGGDLAGCSDNSPDTGVHWSQTIQDASSSTTGVSAFDFDADGSAEVVYGDECYLRIYDGATGTVRLQVDASTATAYEYPVVADVDGDFSSELIVATNSYASIPCGDSSYSPSHGVTVIEENNDAWAAARPVWSQHAYAVTHVGNAGGIPRTSAVAHNWTSTNLNSFRQNVAGDLQGDGYADLTTGGTVDTVACNGTVATLQARVCNRGTLPLAPGATVEFFEGSTAGTALCQTSVAETLPVAGCLLVNCDADLGGATLEVFVTVDAAEVVGECFDGNNHTLYRNVGCGKIPY